MQTFSNPFRPGAGHMPPYLAGREQERDEFERLLQQDIVLENLILTGLRGVGKTVLLETFKPLAMKRNWLWVGTDLSESSSLTEERIAIRLLTDLSVVTSSFEAKIERTPFGLAKEADPETVNFGFNFLMSLFNQTPGLVSDKLKAVLIRVAEFVGPHSKGLIFAYDEAQVMADHSDVNEFPMSLLLDVFQSIQKQNIPFMLALTGLPTLFPKLEEARTYAERMFRVVQLEKLNAGDSREAVTKPIETAACPVHLTDESINLIVEVSGGYPYFIQFICREVYDVFVQRTSDDAPRSVPMEAIIRKLDSDFFAGRWARVTDRQRELMIVIAHLETCEEFTVQEVAELSKTILEKGIGSSQVNQMLSTLGSAGLIYKNRHGRYSFAVPLMERFIRRQISTTS